MRRLAVLLFFAPLAVRAQGTISGQGFGYPAGQIGARAAGAAGALAPFDSVSPVNPAGFAAWGTPGFRFSSAIFFHLEPEYRSTSVQGVSSNTRLSRFPLAGIAQRISSKGVLGLTFSTYLDRTWETESAAREMVGSDSVDVITRYRSSGAINDLRLALAWKLTPRVRIGGAYHAYTGENRLAVGWDFPADAPYGDVTESSRLSYAGSGVSGGVDWAFSKNATVAAYARWGGEARLRAGDTLISTGRMPDHLGSALRYTGIKGTTLAASWERVQWSALRPLSTTGLDIHDADRVAGGVETRGPLWRGERLSLRLGVARRSLPFETLGNESHETLVSFGMGRSVARKLGTFDVALQRASRSAGSVSERAWLLTFGLTISP